MQPDTPRTPTRAPNARAFTLVEILIVIVILGILAALVVPSFANAVSEARQETTVHELLKIRRAVEVYRAGNNDAIPDVEAGYGTWGALTQSGEYLKEAPLNAWVGGENAGVIALGDGPDTEYQTTYGWIFNAATGGVWAGSFDADDEPLIRP